MSHDLNSLRQRKAKLEAEIRNLTRALADGYSLAVVAEIATREKELSSIEDHLLASEPGSLQNNLSELREWVHHSLSNLLKLLSSDPIRARTELMRHIQAIVLEPQDEAGKRFCVATGEWNLLGNEAGPPDEAAPLSLRMVAGAGFEPATFGL